MFSNLANEAPPLVMNDTASTYSTLARPFFDLFVEVAFPTNIPNPTQRCGEKHPQTPQSFKEMHSFWEWSSEDFRSSQFLSSHTLSTCPVCCLCISPPSATVAGPMENTQRNGVQLADYTAIMAIKVISHWNNPISGMITPFTTIYSRLTAFNVWRLRLGIGFWKC